MGIPGWALALAAPYGLEKFVVEPTQGIYNFAQGIKNNINQSEDNQYTQQALKKTAKAKTVEDFDRNIAELENTPFNDYASYQKVLNENITKRDKLIEDQSIDKTSQFVTQILDSKDPKKSLEEYVAKGGVVDLRAMNKIDKGLQEARNLFKDTIERKVASDKEENQKKFYADVAPLFKSKDENGNIIPFEQKQQQVYGIASKYGFEPEKALKDFETLYTKTVGPLQDFKVGRTTVGGQTNAFGEFKADGRSVQPVTNINMGNNSKYGVTAKDLFKEMNRARAVYDKAIQGQVITTFDDAGTPLQSVERKFSKAELEALRNTANQSRRAYQQATGAKTMAPSNGSKQKSKAKTSEATDSKTINGVQYEKINGQWYSK